MGLTASVPGLRITGRFPWDEHQHAQHEQCGDDWGGVRPIAPHLCRLFARGTLRFGWRCSCTLFPHAHMRSQYAFAQNDNLETVTLGNSLKEIGNVRAPEQRECASPLALRQRACAEYM